MRQLPLKRVLHQFLTVDSQNELQPQFLRCFFTEDHTGQEDFKVIHHRTDGGIDPQLQFDFFVLRTDQKLRFFYRIVHTVVNIEGDVILVADSRIANIALVRQDQRRGNRIDRKCRLFIYLLISYRRIL